MADEKKSFFKKIVVTAKKVYSFLNKDIGKSKKSKQKKQDDIKINEEESNNTSPKENENAKNVFDIIDESTKETVDSEEKAIEEELIPQPEEIEAKTPKVEDKNQDEIELEVAQVDSSKPEADQNESQTDQEMQSKEQDPIKASQPQEVTTNAEVQEVKDNVVESSVAKQEEEQEQDEVDQKELSEIAEPEHELTTGSSDAKDLETVDLNSDPKFKSIIRPDSVLSYLDDIVMQQEKHKNKTKIQKVYKKNKDSHVIMPD